MTSTLLRGKPFSGHNNLAADPGGLERTTAALRLPRTVIAGTAWRQEKSCRLFAFPGACRAMSLSGKSRQSGIRLCFCSLLCLIYPITQNGISVKKVLIEVPLSNILWESGHCRQPCQFFRQKAMNSQQSLDGCVCCHNSRKRSKYCPSPVPSQP